MSNYRGATRPSIVRRLEVCTRKRCCGAVRWHCQSGHCDRQSGRPTMQHMARQFHFISGLPRSGSTLLGAVLRQNPRFSAGMMSPIGSLLGALQTHFSAGSEFGPVVEVDLRRRLLRGLFESYYGDRAAGGVVFDSNRAWCARLPSIKDLYPGAKVIACVRNVAWVMDSIERLYRANPFENTKLFNDDVERNTVYSRVETLAQGGRLALALVGLMPVRLTVLAPAEVVPAEPFLVRAPLDGCVASATSGQNARRKMRDFELLRAPRRRSEVDDETGTSTIYGRAETGDLEGGGPTRGDRERGVPTPCLGGIGLLSLAGGGPGRLGGSAEARRAAYAPQG